PHSKLFAAVQECIEAKGTTSFQNECGISEESFLELLQFYLSATVVAFEGKTYLQKKGICIGSCVAPVLCDIFLSQCDRAIANALPIGQVSRIFRYVDDYLVLLTQRPADNEIQIFDTIQSTFFEKGQGLKFTHELPVNTVLQFLDLRLSFFEHHTCWKYAPRSKKGLLPYDSAHSKIIKRGIVKNSLNAALKKSCVHSAGESFHDQVQRLQDSGYPSSILYDVAESIITSRGRQKIQRDTNIRPAVLPYIHRISHNLKKVASKFNVKVVLSAPDKLKKLCPKINNKQQQQGVCGVQHQQRYVECQSAVVYEIPFTCGKVYVGQTGRCVNDRLREHAASLKSSPAGHFAIHVRDCQCSALFRKTKILKRFGERRTRELYEAQVILSTGDACVSAPSVALSPKELYFLNRDI
ncbi:unnamed protein product, partial [Ixodes persulcatus]